MATKEEKAALAKVPATTAALSTAFAVPEGFVDDVRSVPLYNVEECKMTEAECKQAGIPWDPMCIPGYPVRGYPVDLDLYGKAPDMFKVMIVKLTAPTVAWVNDEKQVVDAGKEIAVRGADIRDLEKYATNPEWLQEFFLQPTGEKMKMKDKFKQPMPLWKRLRSSAPPVRRADVAPGRMHVRPAESVDAQLARIKSGDAPDTSFDPKQMGG